MNTGKFCRINLYVVSTCTVGGKILRPSCTGLRLIDILCLVDNEFLINPSR